MEQPGGRVYPLKSLGYENQQTRSAVRLVSTERCCTLRYSADTPLAVQAGQWQPSTQSFLPHFKNHQPPLADAYGFLPCHMCLLYSVRGLPPSCPPAWTCWSRPSACCWPCCSPSSTSSLSRARLSPPCPSAAPSGAPAEGPQRAAAGRTLRPSYRPGPPGAQSHWPPAAPSGRPGPGRPPAASLGVASQQNVSVARRTWHSEYESLVKGAVSDGPGAGHPERPDVIYIVE